MSKQHLDTQKDILEVLFEKANDNFQELYDSTASELSRILNLERSKADILLTTSLQKQIDNLVLGAVGDGNNPEVIQARGDYDTLGGRLTSHEDAIIGLEDLIDPNDLNRIGDPSYGSDWQYDRADRSFTATRENPITGGNGGITFAINKVPDMLKCTLDTTDAGCNLGLYLRPGWDGASISSVVSKNYPGVQSGTQVSFTGIRSAVETALANYPDSNLILVFWNNGTTNNPTTIKVSDLQLYDHGESYEVLQSKMLELYGPLMTESMIGSANVGTSSSVQISKVKNGYQVEYLTDIASGNGGLNITMAKVPKQFDIDLTTKGVGVNTGFYFFNTSGGFVSSIKNYSSSNDVTKKHYHWDLDKVEIENQLAANPDWRLRFLAWNSQPRNVGDSILVENIYSDSEMIYQVVTDKVRDVVSEILEQAQVIADLQSKMLVKGDVSIEDIKITNPQLSAIEDWSKWGNSSTTFEDGILSYEFTSDSGNNGFQSKSISKTTRGFLQVELNILEISRGVRMYVSGKKTTDGTANYVSIVNITEAGAFSRNIDLNNLAVYNNLDLSKPYTVLLANSSGPASIKLDKFNVFDSVTDLDTSKSLSENLNDMQSSIAALRTEIGLIDTSSELSLADENGQKYILQVSGGQLKVIPKLPSNILYIGNSLLLGFGTFGMCASNNKEDYYTYVNDYLTEQGKSLTTDRLGGSPYEGCTTSEAQDTWLNGSLLPKLNDQLELVIVQLSDNVNTPEKNAVFEEGAKKMCQFIREHAPNARVAWVTAWYYNSTKQTWIANACSQYGCVFIDITDLPAVSGNRSYVGAQITYPDGSVQEVTSDGVASHPSSQGMKQVADRIIEKLFK